MNVEDVIAEYLGHTKMMHLATVANGRPWVCNVWFAADKDLNLYWFSGINRRHSAEVAANQQVSGGIVANLSPQDKPRGIQFEGTAQKLSDPRDIELATKLFTGRIFPADRIEAFRTNADNPHDFYRIKPSRYVLFDTVNFPADPFQELTIKN